ncbi:MAG: hypothetical protein GXP25_18210 [Planctomycetes bacterium]|nr:hypothetical protein [Planctomycetota bacterium]
MRRLTILLMLLIFAAPALALDFDDADMEKPDRGPWNIYGTPVTVEKSDFARNGLRSLRVVTDNEQTMGGNYEGTSHTLGKFQPGDLIKVSFWYWVKGGRNIIVGIGPTYFQRRVVMTGTDWTRAEVTLRVTKAGHHSIWISQGGAPTEFFLDDFSLEVTRRPQLGTAAEGQRIAITGGPLRLALCKETGALCGIENLKTGETYAPLGRRQPLFGMELLSKDGLGYERLSFENAKPVSIDCPGPKLAKLTFEMKNLPIRIRIQIKMNDDGSANFAGEVKNDSDRRVLSLEMPMIYGASPAKDPKNLTLVDPHICGRIVPDAAKSAGCQTRYPGRGVMGWMDLSGEHGGIYLATHDKHQTGTRLMALPTPDARFDMSLTREIVVRPGETWRAPLSVLAVHEGDWHAAADRYRAWARSWMQKPDVPQWMYDDNGWVLMGIQNGIPFRRIPDIFRQAQWMGIEYLHVQGEAIDNMWFDADGKRHGHTMTYPYPTPKYGTVDELKAAIRKIHNRDGHVMFYFLYERWTPSHETSDNFGTGKRSDVPEKYWPPKGLYSSSALVESPGRKPSVENPFMAIRNMCLASPGWQEWMRRWAIDVYAKEYGADGFYWDVMGRNGPFRCFNANHEHEGENQWAAGSAKVLDTVIREGRKVNPDYSCAIEGCSDHLGQWVGYHLMSGATKQPNVFRYTFPEYLCVDGLSNHYWKWTQTQKARRVFLDGEKFDIHGYQQQIKQIINLRRRVKPFIDWPAVFRDTVGLKISDEKVQARCFVRTDDGNRIIAVTMMNEEHVEGATVEIDLSPIGRATRGHIFHLDGHVSFLDATTEGKVTIPVPKDDVSCAVLCGGVSPELQVHAWLEQIMEPGTDGVMLNIYTPHMPAKNLSWKIDWPEGFAPKEVPMPGESFGWDRVMFVDNAHLKTLKRWTKVKAHLIWDGGKKTVWTVIAPPIVNGNMEEVEDGRLVYWGLPPCTDDPGEGKQCLRIDRTLTVYGHLRQLTPLKPSTKYRLRCMIKRTGEKWAGAHIIEYEVGRQREAKFVRSATLNSTKIGEWETLETTFTTHPNPRSTAIYLYNTDKEQPAFFDAIEIEEVREK